MKTTAVAIVLAALVTSALGCGIDRGEAYTKSFDAAQRAQHAGRYEEAAGYYAQAVKQARRLKDRDEAYYLEARMYERLERWRDARATYEELERVSPKGPRTGRAVYDRAHLSIEHGDGPAGFADLEQALLRHPNHGSARRALRLWIAHKIELGGEDLVQTELIRLHELLRYTLLAQQLQYELGQSYWRSQKLREAHAQFLTTARTRPYPKGNLTDDAYWQASHVAEELGDIQLAVADLQELLSSREVAIGGSYERPRFPQAQMRIAELYRGRGDLTGARREYRRVYRTHASSILADDAMWNEAVLAKRQGDVEAACDLAEDLPSRFEGSRYTSCVRELCPTASPASEPPAKDRPCPPYIVRQLSDEPAPSEE